MEAQDGQHISFAYFCRSDTGDDSDVTTQATAQTTFRYILMEKPVKSTYWHSTATITGRPPVMKWVELPLTLVQTQ